MTQTATPLLQHPLAVAAYLAAVLALIFWLDRQPRLRPLFTYTPPVIYAYFVPTLSTTFGITPAASPTYAWMARWLLPVALLLLMITVDLRAIARLGRLALIMMLTGTVGIVIGGPIAYLVFGGFLPDDAWMAFAALSGSWIGGTANMVAIQQSVGTPDALMGPIIVVDTVVGYGWMGILLLFAGWQTRWDRAVGADRSAIDAANRRLAELQTRKRPFHIGAVAAIVALGFAGAAGALALSSLLPPLGDPTIISRTTWAVLVIVTGGLLLSFTPVSRLEEWGASRIGYVALYLLLTSIGAQANLRAVLDAPLYLAAGALWIAIHVGLLFLVGRLVRAPLFFIATGSMANVGGAASAPVVAGVYHPAMAPVGLLMAVAGYVLGIYGGLACAWLLALVAT